MGWFRFAAPQGRRHKIDHGMGGWHPEWEQQALPGYGSAQQFSFETLALAPRKFSNGYEVPTATMVTQPPQIEHVQQVRLDGYGVPAGTMALPSLYDPSANLGKLSK